MRNAIFALLLTLGGGAAAQADVLLNVNMVKGFATVSINGQKIGTYGKKGVLDPTKGAITTVNVTKYLKGRANQMTVSWSGGKPTGEVRVSESLNGKYRKIGAVSLGVMSKPSGSQTVRFNVGGSGLANAAPNRPQPGSGDRQTLMTANITRGDLTVFVNGEKVGDYGPGLVPIDISDYAKRGSNSLKVTWSGAKPLGSIRVSYAATKNAFRKLSEYDLNVFTKRSSGGTVTFKVP